MNLEDYFKQEGIINQNCNLKELVIFSNPVIEKEFENITYVYMDENIPRNISAYYDFVMELNLSNVFLGRYYSSIIQTIPKIQKCLVGDSVLDVGCGNGLKTIFYALNNPDKKFLGMDISSESIKNAISRKQKYGLHNVNFILQDMSEVGFAKKFDSIIADKVLHETRAISYGGYYASSYYEPQFRKHLATLSNVLADNGEISVALRPSCIDTFMGSFEFFVNNANLKVENVDFIDYILENEKQTDVLYTLVKL